MAEQVLVPARAVSPVPPGLSLTEAAAFRVTYLTAYHALVTAGGLRPGQWVVVLGAAGGVGTATVDVAVRLGARVIAAASSPERLKVCAQLGAEAGIDYVREDLKQRIKEITGDGADLVVDPVGDRWAEPALRAIRWGGRFVSVGYAGGDIPRIPLNIVLLKNITVRGLELRTWTERLPEETARAREALTELVARGMRPAVSEVHATRGHRHRAAAGRRPDPDGQGRHPRGTLTAARRQRAKPDHDSSLTTTAGGHDGRTSNGRAARPGPGHHHQQARGEERARRRGRPGPWRRRPTSSTPTPACGSGC